MIIDDLRLKGNNNFNKPMKCNCSDETADIKNAIQTLKIVQNCWADQIPNKGEKISDADAINQSIRCLEEYLESNERVKNAIH